MNGSVDIYSPQWVEGESKERMNEWKCC
jgi:hypothetical protein